MVRIWCGAALAGVCLASAVLGAEGGGSIAGRVRVVDRAGGPVKSPPPVVVFVEDLEEPFRPKSGLEVSQEHRQFKPDVLVVPMRARVAFPNKDQVDHNVFSIAPDQPIDLGLYGPGTSKAVTFERPGATRLYCNVHPEMIADVVVVTNPYYAMVGRDGVFEIPGVPPGTRSLRAWLPTGPSVGLTAQVVAGQKSELAIELKQTVDSAEHADKHGEPYKAGY